jgi:hypothetical protein
MVDIFVSIASYKDDLLIDTINNLFENAKNPDKIRIVVFNQTDYHQYDHHLYDFGNRKVEIISIDYKNTKGVCWVRHKIQTFIENEKYYVQIDAHMRFTKHWDDILIKYLKLCNSKKPIISYYPPSFNVQTLECNNEIIKNEIRGLNLYACSAIGMGLDKNACNLDNGDNLPIPATTIAAGFIFTYTEYVKEVPYDPNIFWNYEESDQTYRSFTNGWSIFGMPECVIWHKYNTSGVMKHYVELPESMHRENRSNEYAEKKYFNTDFKTEYPLGNVRTLNEFEILNNINFKEKKKENIQNKELLIVVPYRNRENHLKDFLEKTPKFFNDRNIDYEILITELDNVGDWNAGLSCNSLINFIKKTKYKYLYIHHVDVYPISGDWLYPKDDELYYNLGDYGSCLTTMDNFLKVGGYRNTFWGWGAEDNDLYEKCVKNNIKIINIKENKDINLVFFEEHQNHERKFVAVNYSSNILTLKTKYDRNMNSVFDTNHYGVTHSLIKLNEKIYKQNIMPLVSSPNTLKNKNAILTYIKNIDEKNVYVFLKSVALFSPYNYDIYIIDASDIKNEYIKNEVIAFGANIIYRDEIITNNICVDRLYAYKDFINIYEYENYIFTDFSDVFFQGNPFEIIEKIDNEYLNVISEGISIKNQLWNYNFLLTIFGENEINEIIENEVINGGVIFGNKYQLMDYVDIVISEYEKLNNNVNYFFGVDQPILNYVIYKTKQLKVNIIREDIPLCINLHSFFMDSDKNVYKDIKIVNDKLVYNSNNELFKIVHQYNRNFKLDKQIKDHFNSNMFTTTW